MPDTKPTVPVGVTTKSILGVVATSFAAAIANALAGGPVADTITAASAGTVALTVMAVGRYAQAITLHGLPLGIAKIVDSVLDRRLQGMVVHPTAPVVPAVPPAPPTPQPGQPTPPAPPHVDAPKSAVQDAADAAKAKLHPKR